MLTLVFGMLPLGLYVWGSRSDTFTVETVELEGCERVARGRAQKLLEKRFLGRNLFRVRTTAVEQALAPLLFVAGVEIDRDFPSTLRVRICEHEPALYALAGTRWYLVSERGIVLGKVAKETRAPDVAAVKGPRDVDRKLPAVRSTARRLRPDEKLDDPVVRRALRVLRAVPPGERAKVRSVSDRKDGMRLRMRSGLVVDLGPAERLPAKSLALNAVLDHYKAQKVACQYIDVSVPDRPIARPML